MAPRMGYAELDAHVLHLSDGSYRGLCDDGRLGHGSAQVTLGVPTAIALLERLVVVDVAAGTHHSAAITESGQLYTWGRGSYGQLGHGDTEGKTAPTVVSSIQGQCYRVSCGDCHTVVVTDDGEVFSFGSGEDGQLGHDNHNSYSTPKIIKVLIGKGVCDVACGLCHTVALRGFQGAAGVSASATTDERKRKRLTRGAKLTL